MIRQPGEPGLLLKSSRFCFFYSENLRAYVRIKLTQPEETGGTERVSVEVCSREYISILKCSPRKSDRGPYILWNENKEMGREIIRNIKFPTRRFGNCRSFIFDLNGELVK